MPVSEKPNVVYTVDSTTFVHFHTLRTHGRLRAHPGILNYLREVAPAVEPDLRLRMVKVDPGPNIVNDDPTMELRVLKPFGVRVGYRYDPATMFSHPNLEDVRFSSRNLWELGDQVLDVTLIGTKWALDEEDCKALILGEMMAPPDEVKIKFLGAPRGTAEEAQQ